ncbi:MAG: 7-cyano-7-deazaguanine synthase QueC [Candidatus Ratteibacteria bacterium]|nr:7-cyano-7-deazaguanine synthase QueC [Candidatus Ratteibacteria bacterium]
MERAVCLISGGIDSFVTASLAKRENYEIYALTVDYGQRNKKEILSARKICRFLKVKKHIITKIDLSYVRSALTNRRVKIPEKVKKGEIPSTYVSARNTIFISLALALAETVDADAIYTGVNAIDFSGYPDCRPVYVKRYQKLIDVATKKTAEGKKIVLKAPLLHLSKADIIRKGMSLGLDLSLTWSCYKSGKRPCGKCPSCIIKKNALSSISQKVYVPGQWLKMVRVQGR